MIREGDLIPAEKARKRYLPISRSAFYRLLPHLPGAVYVQTPGTTRGAWLVSLAGLERYVAEQRLEAKGRRGDEDEVLDADDVARGGLRKVS